MIANITIRFKVLTRTKTFKKNIKNIAKSVAVYE